MDGIRQVAGQRVRQLRKEHLFVQAELAFRAGLHPRTLQRLEAGHGSFESFRAVAAALDVDAADLFAPDRPPSEDRDLAAAVERFGHQIIGTGTLSSGGNFIIVAACKP